MTKYLLDIFFLYGNNSHIYILFLETGDIAVNHGTLWWIIGMILTTGLLGVLVISCIKYNCGGMCSLHEQEDAQEPIGFPDVRESREHWQP